MSGRSDLTAVLEALNGYRKTCLLVSGVRVGLFQALSREPRDVEEVATELGLLPDALLRLARGLAAMGYLEVQEAGLTVSETGRLLGEDKMGAGLRNWATLIGSEYLTAWGNLDRSLKSETAAFEQVEGMPVWQHRRDHPELNRAFNEMAATEQRRTVTALLRVYDFPTSAVLVDVGGGHGVLLKGLLEKLPQAQGVLYDLEQALEEVEPAPRLTLESGSFLERVPRGGDVYLLKHVLHNWGDGECLTILGRCREALGKSGKLLVLEHLLEPDTADSDLLFMDLHMMVVQGGRERSLEEYQELIERAGLRFERLISTRRGAPSVLEASL